MKLQQFEFRKFLYEPRQDRFRISEHLKSIISTKKVFPEQNRENNFDTESNRKSSTI